MFKDITYLTRNALLVLIGTLAICFPLRVFPQDISSNTLRNDLPLSATQSLISLLNNPPEKAKLLVDLPLNPGGYPICWAIMLGDIELFRKVVALKPNCSLNSNNFKSPIMLAIESKHYKEMVPQMLLLGADINCKHGDRRFPIFSVFPKCSCGAIETEKIGSDEECLKKIEFLASSGADIFRIDESNHHFSLLSYARKCGFKKTSKYLEDRGVPDTFHVKWPKEALTSVYVGEFAIGLIKQHKVVFFELYLECELRFEKIVHQKLEGIRGVASNIFSKIGYTEIKTHKYEAIFCDLFHRSVNDFLKMYSAEVFNVRKGVSGRIDIGIYMNRYHRKKSNGFVCYRKMQK